MPQTGDGPFQRGERLTAAKLNDLADGRKLNAAGSARINRDTAGEVIQVDDAEIIFIRLTDKDTTKTPIRYSWKEVVRNTDSSNNTVWLDTTRTALKTDDYAIELNNQNLSTSDGYVYRAERSPHTGEWLFFLRKRASTGGGTCVSGKCTKMPRTIEFDLGIQNPAYAGPTPPVYYRNNYMETQTGIGGAVCPFRLSTYTNHYSIFRSKAISLFPYGQRVTITGLNANGGSASVDLGDVTADLLPFLPQISVSSWAGVIHTGNTCPSKTGEFVVDVVAFKATQYAAVYVDPTASVCAIYTNLIKGIRVDLTLKITNRTYTYSTNPATGALVTNVQTDVSYCTWSQSIVGSNFYDSPGPTPNPGPGYSFPVNDFVTIAPGCSASAGSSLWGTWAITEWI